MDVQITQDDVIYFVVTDRFFGANKKSVDPSDTSLHRGMLDWIIDIFAATARRQALRAISGFCS